MVSSSVKVSKDWTPARPNSRRVTFDGSVMAELPENHTVNNVRLRRQNRIVRV
jgi:hypothetical protein